jgi:hypothetical protein
VKRNVLEKKWLTGLNHQPILQRAYLFGTVVRGTGFTDSSTGVRPVVSNAAPAGIKVVSTVRLSLEPV